MPSTTLSLLGLLNRGLPIQDLERLWLESSCFYAVFNENILEDTEWDHLSRELWDRRSELSPYFAKAVNLDWPVTTMDDPEENPLKTAMGVKWDVGLPAIVSYGIKQEGRPQRVTLWAQRLESLRGWQERKDRLEALQEGYREEREAKNARRRKKGLTAPSPPATN